MGPDVENYGGDKRSDDVAAPVERIVMTLESVLTKHEADFVRAIYAMPGCKRAGESSHWEDDGSEYGKSVTHWENPEKLGLIECVGSYKWVPTNKLDLCIVGS